MPLLHHAMRRTLAGNSQAIELAGETDGEITDIDHFLHFAAAFGSDLASLYHYQAAQVLLGGSQLLAQESDEFAPTGRWNQAPCLKGQRPVIDGFANRCSVGALHFCNRFASRRRTCDPGAFLIHAAIDAKVLKDRIGLMS